MSKTIQTTIDEPLLQQMDEAIQRLKITRSAFIREALQQALRQLQIRMLEEKHAAGYARHPIDEGEFDGWASEMFGDET